jgi:myo-inositol-1(or 4)-monophosphatase
MQNLKDITLAVNVLTLQVGEFIREQQYLISAKDVQTKSLNSLVTYVDIEAEKMLVSGLREILPEAGFLTEEETTSEEKGETFWIIDPLDGTTNFLHGLPVFAISIALMHEGEIVVGVVYEIGHSELFYAWKNGGAFLNEKPIRVSAKSPLKDTLLATGFPYHDFSKMPQYMNLLQDCFRLSRGMRRIGSAATDLAYVAAGRFDGFFEYGLNPWDVAAGCLLVTEAGGKVSDFSRGSKYIFENEIVCGSTEIFEELFALVNKHLGE